MIVDEPRSSSAGEVVGIIPAAGHGRRSAPLPCSKEIFPVGSVAANGIPKPACAYLLEAMRAAGAHRAIVGLRAGKWDIPAYLVDGRAFELDLAYVVVADSPGVPWTVQRALSVTENTRVLFGFPDIVFRPVNALARVERRQRETGADVVLGLFPARRPEKMDMVDVDGRGRVRQLVIKPRVTELRSTWILAAWSPTFTAFLDAYLRERDPGHHEREPQELHLGDVVGAALADGWRVEAEEIPDGIYCDIGTPEELADAQREFG